jgi:ribosome-binding protein aMBF1 (putative translation factor)
VSTEERQTQNELIPMSLGEMLLQARAKQGLSLEKASLVLRIKPDVLGAIESGGTEHVPSVYLKGYMPAAVTWACHKQRLKSTC